MKRKTAVLLTILLVAAALRLYQLGQNPPSLDWDEASIGYNAYSILKTGKDEYGNSFPIAIRSFNDYKPPLYTYAAVSSIAVFGLTEFAVRFPSALAGILTVLVTYFLVKELFTINKTIKQFNNIAIAALAALLLAISPWHLQFSRVAFEANLALFFFTLAMYLFLKWLRSAKAVFLFGSSIAFASTMYTYHSARAVVPAFILLMALIFRKLLVQRWKEIGLGFIVGLFLMVPIALTFIRGSAQARFSVVSVFTNPGIYTQEQERLERQAEYRTEDSDRGSIFAPFHQRSLVFTTIIVEGYLKHFNFDFLFLRGDGIGRHSAVGMGLLYLWEFPFLLYGLYTMIKDKWSGMKLIFPWLAVAPLASALTTQAPHAVRALLMLPVLQIITAYGIIHALRILKKNRYVSVFIGLLVCINFVYYLNLYYIHTPIERSHDWQYGYKEMVEIVTSLGDDAETVIVTQRYDQPYIFFLFYDKTDPSYYQSVAESGAAGFGKYRFRKVEYAKDSQLPRTLIIGAPDEIPSDATVLDTVKFRNGKTAFVLVRT